MVVGVAVEDGDVAILRGTSKARVGCACHIHGHIFHQRRVFANSYFLDAVRPVLTTLTSPNDSDQS